MSKRKYETYLNDVSEVVMATEDKKSTLATLKNEMSARYQPSLETLESVLNGHQDSLNDKKYGLWQVLQQLAQQSNRPFPEFIKQFTNLADNRVSLTSAYKANLIGYGYIFILSCLVILFYLSFRYRTMPVFQSFFDDFGATLPPITQFVMGDWFIVFVLAIFTLVLFIGVVIPRHYRKALANMRPIPFYLRLLPMYYRSNRYYHHNLWLIYSSIYADIGEDNPFSLATKQIPGLKTNADELVLLQTAYKSGKLKAALESRQPKLINELVFRIKTAEGIIGGLVLLLYGYLVYITISAMYAPIFMLGGTIS